MPLTSCGGLTVLTSAATMFGLGGGASPAGAGAMTAAGAGGALTVDGVISSNLVAYKDVGELQTQNQRLLRALRQLGDDHERALSEKDEAADAQVAALPNALPPPPPPSARRACHDSAAMGQPRAGERHSHTHLRPPARVWLGAPPLLGGAGCEALLLLCDGHRAGLHATSK